MPVLAETTLLYCKSDADGTITPNWSAADEAVLQGCFEVGLTIDDRYLLQRTLGQGAMGRVFLARDLRLDRQVAIKVVIHRHESVDLEASLEREAKLGASLNHKGIAAVFDFGFQHEKSYTVFEYVAGDTLRTILQRRGKIPLAETLSVVLDLAAAIDFAHAKGVVHRDLKPENICFTPRGEFKILDFGIAWDSKRDVETRTYSGTPAYSAPEQAECRLTNSKSDQYALALIVFEMLTGRQVFIEASPWQLLRRHIGEQPPQPRQFVFDLPDNAERAILRALSKNPDDRFGSCQEFARELGGGVLPSSLRHLVSTPMENRFAFYIAQVAEESLLARQMAEQLKPKLYTCWFYGRDALPGVPFVRQSKGAIERSQAVILLISRAAIRSTDFIREIEHAHHVGCPILPLLIDISREEFDNLARPWNRLLGAASIIECRRSEFPGAVVNRIAEAAESLEIVPDQMVAPLSAPLPRRCTGQLWATDANQIDILDLERVLFRNSVIEDFLNGKHRHFISATKGFGKTLLLTCKRQRLADTSAPNHQTPLMIPEGRPYLDFMSEMRSLSARYEQPLSELSNTKRLWNAALRISAISHHPGVVDENEQSEIDLFPDRLRRWLGGAKIQPTVVFKELTALSVSELNRLIDRTENFLDQKLRMIHGATCFFVDKVDQAIRHLSRDAWIAIQAGLLEAAWEMMNANSHIKVFASIRQEAFTNYESDIKSNLSSATTTLSYSEHDLQLLLDQLARGYEGCQSFADFLGLNVVRHGRRPAPEDCFQYVRRHTFGRPRDFVAIASEVSSHRMSVDEKRLREIVQQTSSTVLVSNIFDEVRVFLDCLGDRESRLRFFSLLPRNILEKSEAIRVCEIYNGLEAGSLKHFGEDSADIFHPFRDLYFAGLLGTIERDPESGISIQRFRRAHDSLVHATAELPDSPMFLIHPALDTFIRAQRTRKPFLQYQHVPVGENMTWEPYFPIILQIEMQLQNLDDQRFVDLAHEIIKRAQALLIGGKTQFTRLEIEQSDEWRTLCNQETTKGNDEALLWLRELLNQL